MGVSGVSGYLKAVTLILLLVAPMQAEAGLWAYRCEFATGNRVSCADIADAANRSITDAFTTKYPVDKYLILFTVTASAYNDGSFSYSVYATLHETRDKERWLRFPSITGDYRGGYHSNPSFAVQRRLLLRAAEIATANLVSEVTGR